MGNYQHFDYFDQFKEMEIDLSKFLTNFSKKDYTLKFSNLQPVTVKIKNLFEQYRILERYKRDASAFFEYSIQDNELIENISYKFYDSVTYWWIIAVFNNIKNPFYDLPLSEQQLIDYSEILADREGKYPKHIYYKLLFEANEKRRKINIPKKENIADVIWEFRQAIIKDR
jgi:hypothetical protein